MGYSTILQSLEKYDLAMGDITAKLMLYTLLYYLDNGDYGIIFSVKEMHTPNTFVFWFRRMGKNLIIVTNISTLFNTTIAW